MSERKEVERFMLYQVAKTDDARLYRNANGAEMWIPRSVCPSVVKSGKTIGSPSPRPSPPGEGEDKTLEQHFVDVETWWLKKHPWPKTAERMLL